MSLLGLDTPALRDVDQELKEAVCDALVNLVTSKVSGTGPEGLTLYGASPRRSIVSGQLLPRLDQSGLADESSDIRISALGIDFQVESTSNSMAHLAPRFSVYVRVLPDWEELKNDGLDFDIQFKLKKPVQEAIDIEIRRLRQERFLAANVATPDWPNLNPNQRQRVRETRNQIVSEVRLVAYSAHGIVLQEGDSSLLTTSVEASDSERTEDEVDALGEDKDTEARLRLGRLLQRGRHIPYALLDDAPPPAKWQRIDFDLPSFEWPLNAGAGDLAELLQTYNEGIRNSILEQVMRWLQSEAGVANAWRDVSVRPEDCATRESWQLFRDRTAQIDVPYASLLPKIEGVAVQVDRVLDYTDPQRASIRVSLDNRTAKLSPRQAATRSDTLFGTGIEVRLPEADHRSLRLDRIEPSYRFRHFLDYPAIGLNCGVESSRDGEGLTLRTSWTPKFVQPRVVPREIDAPITFDQLRSESLPIAQLFALPQAYGAWIEGEQDRLRHAVREGLSAEDADRESHRLTEDTGAQRAELVYIEKGIRLLEESQRAYRQESSERDDAKRQALIRRAAPYRAWLLTNEAFFERDGKQSSRGWRLFQLAFILAHIPTFASRMEEYRGYQDSRLDEDTASLLYFPTGGGKSEAFYGALLFAMFLDRLRGKERGVTALVRYPLRLLTLQQGQRLLKLVTFAELVRKEKAVGGWPFEIGFWVGGTNTPNRYNPAPAMVPLESDEAHRNDTRLDQAAESRDSEEREEAHRYCEYRESYNKVPSCPVCGEVTGLRRFEAEGPTARRLGIVCFNGDCKWNRQHDHLTPLPFLLTDDTIYARAPSVVLGTIDKMAMLGQHTATIRQLLGMFGLARGIGPTGHLYTPSLDGDTVANLASAGYEPVFPAFRGGRPVFKDPFPSLVIQDEAHLLEESLGTFSGLFDSALERTFRAIEQMAGDDLDVARVWTGDAWSVARLPKFIAATATISNPDRQLEVLYQREPLRFPTPGSDIYHSFFSCPAPAPAGNRTRVALEQALPEEQSPERTAPWMRLFASVMTNDATHTVTSVAVLSAFHGLITSMWNDLQDNNRRGHAVARLRASQTPGPSADWRIAAIDRAARDGREAEILALIDLHRVALAYVTNKKGGDQVMDALETAVEQRDRGAKPPPMPFLSRLISGGVDMREIQDVMKLAETGNPGLAYPDVSDRLRSIVATSAISHGVDVDRFNSMFFAGLPSDIAEYIQASSRVGRFHVGFVMLIPTPQSRRDRYVVETHDVFHRFLERMIAPPAVERWAENAIRRVMASFIQTWAMLHENSEFLALADNQKPRARSYESIASIAALARSDQVGFINQVGSFVLQCVGYEGRGARHIGRPIYAEHYRALVESEIGRFALSMRSTEAQMRLSEYWKDSTIFKPPMTSLRDVDEAGLIVGGAYDAKARGGRLRVDSDDLIKVMKTIRSQRGLVAETDNELPAGGPDA